MDHVKFKDDPVIEDTADATPVVVAGGDLRKYHLRIQVSAGAGTALLEVTGPGGAWVEHTAALDCTADAFVILGASEVEVYRSARVTFTGTSNTNTLHVSRELRKP